MMKYTVYRPETLGGEASPVWIVHFENGQSVCIVEQLDPFYGYCTQFPTIIINRKRHRGRGREREELDTWVHELLHCFCQSMNEDEVTVTANMMAAILWEMGYRRNKKRASISF